MKKVLLVLGLAIGFIACEKETVIVIEDEQCEECQGATVSLAPQARGPVDRGTMYAWIDVITVVATDDQNVNYGDVFNIVDDNSGADGFYLENVPVNEIIDFSASSTSKTDGSGKLLVNTGNPDNLDGFLNRMPYAEYATDAPVSQYIENGDNIVSLQMNTDHGRLISSFQLANDIQYNNQNNSNLPMYKLVVKRGAEEAYATGASGVVSYWNDANSTGGVTQTFNIEVQNYETGAVVYTRTITETFVASTSTTNKYVVGLDFVDNTTVEVIFTWQVWNETEGDDETNNCNSAVTTNYVNYIVDADVTVTGEHMVLSGDLNFNGNYTLTIVGGSITIEGNTNANNGGEVIHCCGFTFNGQNQNGNLTVTQSCD